MKLDDFNKTSPSYYDLIEKNNLEDKPEIKEAWNLAHTIKRRCNPYLNAVGNYPVTSDALYRGIKHGSSMGKDFLIKQVRLDGRTPGDSSMAIHKYVNTYFANTLGEPFRNALFVTGNRGEATGYGQVYIVFPIGEFTYAWSDQVQDMYTEAGVYSVDGNPVGSAHDIKDWIDNADFFAEEKLSTYRTDLLHEAIDSGHEIMIRCKSYYAMREHITSLDTIENNRVQMMMQGIML